MSQDISLPAILVQLLDEYHAKGATGIIIKNLKSHNGYTVFAISANIPPKQYTDATTIIQKYVDDSITPRIELSSMSILPKEGKKELTEIIKLSDGEYECNCNVFLNSNPYEYKITITLIEKIHTSVDISNSPSALDQIMKLADRQDFEAAIASISKYLHQSLAQLVYQKKIQEAKEKQIRLEAQIESAACEAQIASCSSRDAWSLPADIFHRKDAIEKLQQAGAEMGEALVKSTDIHLSIIDSQTTLLEVQAQQLYYQKLLMDLSKGLLLLGAYNQQTNKALYEELRKQLRSASSQTIGELGMRELQSVAAQLKEHQDMLTRIEALEEKVAHLITLYNGR